LSEQRISPSSQNRLSTEVVVVGNVLGSLFVVVVVVIGNELGFLFDVVVDVVVVVVVDVDDVVVVVVVDDDVVVVDDSVVVKRSDVAANVDVAFDSVAELEVEVEDVVCLPDLVGVEVLAVVLDDDGVDLSDVVGEAVVVCFEGFVFFVVGSGVNVVDEGSALGAVVVVVVVASDVVFENDGVCSLDSVGVVNSFASFDFEIVVVSIGQISTE
jgi:hypothetical protein